MRENRVNHLLRVSPLPKNPRPPQRVLRRIRAALIVEVVQQRSRPPQMLVRAESPGVSPHGRLDRQHMANESLIADVLANQQQARLARRTG